MNLIADGLLLIAAASAAIYCAILSRRLSRLSGLDDGLGKAIVSLSSRADELKAALADAKRTTEKAQDALRLQVDLAARQAEDLATLIEQAAGVAKALGDTEGAERREADIAAAEAAAEKLVEAARAAAETVEARVLDPESAEFTAGLTAAPAEDVAETPAASVAASVTAEESAPVAEPAAEEVVVREAAPEPEPAAVAASESVERPAAPKPAPRKSLADSLDVIRRARDADDDEAFAARLVDALSALQPAGAGAR